MDRKAADILIDANVRILLLVGSEQMVKQQCLDQLRSALQAEHGELQTMLHEGRSATLSDVLDELRTFSLMQQYKLVIVDEAGDFVNENTRPALERYAQSPVDHATLVLRSVKWNSPKLDKLIAKVGGKVKCEPLKGAALKKWLTDRAKDVHDCKLTAQAATVLIARLGSSMTQLDSELGKLAVLAGAGEPITPGLIDEVVGRGSDEQAWAVQDALIEAMLANSGLSGKVSGGRGIEKVHEVIELSGQPEVLVAYFVADLMRNLYLAMQAKRQGMNQGDISRQFKLWGPRLALLRRLDERSSGRLFDRIVDYDARSKSGFGNSLRNLECFCAALADEIQSC